PGISAVGIPALVPFRDRIARTRDRRSAGAVTDAAVGRGARLQRHAGGASDRHPPRRIRTRRAATYRGNTIDNCRLVRLAEAVSQSGMMVAICGPSSRSQPKSLVNIEFHRTLVTHLQKERLAVVLMPDVDALHDLEGFQGLFAKRNQNFFSISHWIPLGASCAGVDPRCADRRQRVRHLT